MLIINLIKNCLIVLLYIFLPWSLTCYLIIGGYYLLWGKKHDHTGDTGTAILFGAPLLPFIMAYTSWQDRKSRLRNLLVGCIRVGSGKGGCA